MPEAARLLPEYETPPVIEVVCGIQFVPINTLTIAHLGRWWSRVANDFPTCREVPPLIPIIERFDVEQGPALDEIGPLPLPRLWLINGKGDQLVQLQKDRFLFNWRKISEEHIYPRYSFVRSSFDRYREDFVAFLQETTQQNLNPIQYELTYINHIPEGPHSWLKPTDIGKILPEVIWQPKQGRFLPEPERIEFQADFILPNRVGRLHVRARNVRRKSDNLGVILLEITARGFGGEIDKWFGLAHEWIVQGFTDLTDTNAQKELWRRVQ